MSIEEKKQILEFSYITNDADNNYKYNIVYNPDALLRPSLKISKGNEEEITYPVELFSEVVEFLQNKGILKPKMSIRGGGIVNSVPQSGGTLPMPQVNKGVVSDTPPPDALSSFDISEPVITESAIVESVVTSSVQDKKPKKSTPSGPVITPDSTVEVTKRPVIRTRIKDDNNPTGAEDEAKLIRGSGEAGKRKTIRRKATE